eukprot:gene9765-9922_t
MSKKNKTLLVDDSGPGPGAYSPKLDSSQCLSSRATGFGTSVRLASYGNHNPGAGEYPVDLGIKATRRRATSASMQGRESPGHWGQPEPGPGHYTELSPSITRPHAPQVSISHRLPASKEAERKPAPGDYSPELYRSKSPIPVSIKHRRCLSATDRPNSGHAVPGPGSYRPQDVTLHFSRAPAHSMGRLGRPSSCSLLHPGPAEYSPSRRSLHNCPAASFGKAERYPAGAYEVKLQLPLRSSPCFTFKGVTAKNHLVKNPSPDQYKPDSCVKADSRHVSAPAISIGQRLPEPQSHERRPDPGEYDVSRPASKGMGVSMKFRHLVLADRVATTPGPGEY